MKIFFFALGCVLLSGCSLPKPNKFSDPTLVTISNFQDRRQTDSLINYLLHKNQQYRAEAALALASVQDSSASLQLGSMLLEDPFISARVNAAFALGQTGGNAAVNALIPALTDASSEVVSEVVQGLGKTVTARDVASLLNFQPKDSIQEHGLAWGFYFAGLRGLSDSIMVSRTTDFLSSRHSTSVRLGAAHFFNRAINQKEIPTQQLIQSATEDKNSFVRMASTLALRKVNTEEHIPAIKQILTSESDDRVRINAVRVAAAKTTVERDKLVLLALNDEHMQVAIAAAEGVQADFKKREELLALARTTKNFRVQATLYKILLVQSPKLAQEIQDVYSKSSNDYHKANLLTALSSDVNSYPFLAKELIESKIPVIKTSAAQALATISKKSQFTPELKFAFSEIYKNAIKDGDTGVISIIASTLADSTLNYKAVITEYSFLKDVKSKLTKPGDLETIQSLDEALAYFEGRKKPDFPKTEFNHPINWKLVKEISTDQRVNIVTDQGVITLLLFVEEVPGSVANFVELVNQKYFDGKFVHRVVPNFVMQAGCNRGDGFGGEGYSIRSEFSLRRYEEGSVGMASSGKDTEGTQWFITHSPTPHLDGHYTIFAKVIEGMEVIRKIEVGDKINDVLLADN